MPIARGLLALLVLGAVAVALVAALVLTRPVQTCSTETLPAANGGVIRTESCMIR